MSDTKNLPMQRQNNSSVQLHDNGLRAGSLLEQSVSRLNEEQAKKLMEKAAYEVLRLETLRHELDLQKDFIEKHIDGVKKTEKDGIMTRRHTIVNDFKTSAGNVRIESKTGATCFVASVAYNDPNHPDVMFLRSFRDNVLNKSESGCAFIAWYWENGPKLAKFVGKSFFLRKIARAIISQIVKLLK